MILSRKGCEFAATSTDRAIVKKIKTCTWKKRWQIQAMGKNFLLNISSLVQRWPSGYITALILLTIVLSSSVAIAQGASWKVGRGVIYGSEAESGLSLKISLRNAGAPSSDPVRIMGRWTRSQPGKKDISRGELASFAELGVFTREVKMKQTVIIDIPLAPAGPRPAEKKAFEVAVITGDGITDGVVIPVDF